ncbi:hypothetical protein VTJ04DRAFT_7768 [Mycothermus thermophilus]|uniref:uncharacterized protein n=1 Tax=Humicola insolens TaxID=85995 RepID=UPI003743B5B9
MVTAPPASLARTLLASRGHSIAQTKASQLRPQKDLGHPRTPNQPMPINPYPRHVPFRSSDTSPTQPTSPCYPSQPTDHPLPMPMTKVPVKLLSPETHTTGTKQAKNSKHQNPKLRNANQKMAKVIISHPQSGISWHDHEHSYTPH